MKLAYSIEEAAEQLACGRDKIFELINSGALRTMRIDDEGRMRRITHEALVEFIHAREAAEKPVVEGKIRRSRASN